MMKIICALAVENTVKCSVEHQMVSQLFLVYTYINRYV